VSGLFQKAAASKLYSNPRNHQTITTHRKQRGQLENDVWKQVGRQIEKALSSDKGGISVPGLGSFFHATTANEKMTVTDGNDDLVSQQLGPEFEASNE